MTPSGWAEINGISIRFDRCGQGPSPVVLIHEIGGTLDSWDEVVRRIEPRCDMLRYDQRGSGLSEKPRGPLRMDDLVDDLAGLMNLEGMEPALLVGCAIGATVGLAFAAAHPERTLGVLAMAPATGIPFERLGPTRENARTVLTEGQRPGIDAKLARSWPVAIREDEERFERLRLQRLSTDPQSTASMLLMLADLDIEPVLRAQRSPVTVLAGRHDGDRPPKGVEDVAGRIAGATFKIVESCHFMHVHAPELVATEILTMLD